MLGSWNKVKMKIKDGDVLLKFNTRDYSGPNYFLQDCDELENKKLRSTEHLLMLNTISDLNTTMNDNTAAILGALNNVGKSIEFMGKTIGDAIGELKISVDGMKVSLDSMKGSLDDMKDSLDDVKTSVDDMKGSLNNIKN
jgi:hypothetical protein